MKIVEPAKKYDFWLRGGRVIDPARSLDGEADVLVSGCRIVPPPENGHIDPADVKEVVDCSGCLVLPGLIDHHVHFSWNTSGITPDVFCLPNGVTAACDAGSVGTNAFENFVRFRILPAITTLQALVNVTTGGMAGAGYMENIDPALYDERAMAYLFDRYRPHLYGFKLRIGKDISEGMGLRPLEESVKLARKYRTRLSLHATYPLEPMPEIVDRLGRGDVLCHTFQAKGPYSILDENGRIFPEVWSARERGVLFDSAQGRIHCSFPVARAAIEQGFPPDVISTDLITFSVYQERLFSLPVTMSRFLALDMSVRRGAPRHRRPRQPHGPRRGDRHPPPGGPGRCGGHEAGGAEVRLPGLLRQFPARLRPPAAPDDPQGWAVLLAEHGVYRLLPLRGYHSSP